MSRVSRSAHPSHFIDDDGDGIDLQLSGSRGSVVGGVASREGEGVETAGREVGGGGGVGDVG